MNFYTVHLQPFEFYMHTRSKSLLNIYLELARIYILNTIKHKNNYFLPKTPTNKLKKVVQTQVGWSIIPSVLSLQDKMFYYVLLF